MADQGIVPDDAALAAAARHALHDEELVVALATGSLDDEGEAGRARSLVERCTLCADLHRDIVGIGSALRAGSAFTATAPRDFRLTAEDARRLGGTVVTPRGFLAALRRSLDALARPAGATLATFGLVGLLVGSVGLGAGSAAAPMAGDTGPAPMATDGGGLNVAGSEQLETPKASGRTTALGPGATDDAGATDGAPRENGAGPQLTPLTWLLAGSVAALVAGLLLLLVAFRRARHDGPSA